jgi:hypothetical protein
VKDKDYEYWACLEEASKMMVYSGRAKFLSDLDEMYDELMSLADYRQFSPDVD